MASPDSVKPVYLVVVFGMVMAAAAVLVLYDPAGSALGGNPADAADPSAQYGQDLSTHRTGARSGSPGGHDTDARQDLYDSSLTEAPVREAISDSVLTSCVKGKVKTPQGDGLPGAELLLHPGLPQALRPLLAGGSYSAEATTGQDGTFEIPLPAEGVFRLEVKKEGFASADVGVVLPGDDLAVVLQPGRFLEGEVRDALSGDVISGAAIRARHHRQTFEAESKANGTFRFGDLPEGIYSLEAFHESYEVERLEGITVSSGSSSDVTLELRSGGTIKGRVSALDTGKPVPESRVTYTVVFRGEAGREEMFRQEAFTNEKGLFFFENVSRRGARIVAVAAGFSPGTPEPFLPPEADPGDEIDIEVFLKRESGVAGVVVDPDGNPLKGAAVRALRTRMSSGRVPRATTDAEGAFRLEGLEGDPGFVLAAYHGLHGTAFSGYLLAARGEILEDVTLPLKRFASIKGAVSAPDGRPFQGARVTLDGIRGFMREEERAAPLVVTDEEGCFAFEKLVPGRYCLASHKGNLRSEALDLTLLEGETLDAALTLENGLALTGKVVDPLGQPLDDVLVTAVAIEKEQTTKRPQPKGIDKKKSSRKAGKEARPAQKKSPQRENDLLRRSGFARFRGNARSDEDGLFCLAGLRRDDNLVVTFRRYGYLTETAADISPSLEGRQVTLKPEAALQGRVADFATNRPLERYRVEWIAVEPGETGEPAEIFKRKARQSRARSVQTLDGNFLIERVEAGEVVLRVSARGYRSSEPRRLFVSPLYGAAFQSFLLDKGGVVTGRVVAADSSPVEGIPVHLGKADQGRERRNKKKKGKKEAGVKPARTSRGGQSRRTDHKGRFEFHNLPEGSYQLVVGDSKRPLVDPRNVRLRRGDNVSKSFVLRDLCGVEVRVTGKAGSCRADVKLTGGPAKAVFRKRSGNLGIVSFRNLLPGKYRLHVQARGYKSFSGGLELEEKGRIKKEVSLEERRPR